MKDTPAMLYTIGYAGLTPAGLEAMVDRLNVDVLVDVRARPASRKPGFSRKALEAQFGARYAWHGDTLGGPGGGGKVQPRGLTTIRKLLDQGKTVMIMCLEQQPETCHRHQHIAEALLPDIDAAHVFEDSLVRTSELVRAIKTDVNAKLHDLDDQW